MQLATGNPKAVTYDWNGERRRVYLQALIDQAGWSVEAIDQFADQLAADSWASYHVPLTRAADLLRAFMAGWDAGYKDGFHDHAGAEAEAATTT